MAWLNKQQRLNRKSGKKETYFAIKWRDEIGKTHTRAVGFCKAKEAQKALKIFEGKIASGELVMPRGFATGSSVSQSTVPTVKEYLQEVWLPVVERDKAPKTHETAVRASRALIPILGDFTIDRVNYALVDAYLGERKKLGRAPRTMILELWCLSGALKHANNCQIIPSLPKLPKIRDRDRKPSKFLGPEQTIALLNALRPFDKQPHKVTRGRPPITRDHSSYLAVLVALNTGARRNEILSRRWQDVKWKQGARGALFIGPREEIDFQVKTRRSRAVPLTPELREELEKAYKRAGSPHDGWIFPSPRNPEKPRREFRKALERACRTAGIERMHPHALRHTWASRLAMAGVDRRTLMELGGWTEGRMLDEVYSHVTDDHMDEVMGKMGISSSVKKED